MSRHIKDVLNRKLIPFMISVLMVINSTAVLVAPVSASAATTAGFNSQCISTNQLDWTIAGAEYSSGEWVLDENGDIAMQEISLSGIQDSVDLGMLEAEFSCNVTFSGTEGASAENAAQAQIEFLDESDQTIGSSSVLLSGTKSAGETATLSTQKAIPSGARKILVQIESKDSEGIFDSMAFGAFSLIIPDDDAPTISAAYDTAWTRTVPLTVTINAADT